MSMHSEFFFDAIARVLSILDQGELLPLAATAVVLFWVGGRLADEPQRRIARRSAAAAYLLYWICRCLRYAPNAAEELFDIALRAALAAGLVCGLLSIAQPLASWIYRISVGALLDMVPAAVATFNRHREHREAAYAYDRSAPERQRAAQEADERASRLADAQRRRDDARAGCEFAYSLCAPEIGERFPREMFDAFMKKYLSDERAPEYVEQRAEQLRGILEQHRNQVTPPKNCTSFVALAGWFAEQKRELETADIDDEVKEVLVINLDRRYDQLMRNMIQELSP